MIRKFMLGGLCILLGAATLVCGQAFVWIEAESPTKANFEFGADTRVPTLYSDGKAFFRSVTGADLAKILPEGMLLSYDFTIAESGTYRFWTRIGMEWVRAPMDWRIDDGEWKTYTENELTTSLMQVAVWNEIAWGDCGLVDLKKGKHRLEIRFNTPIKDRILYGLDCFAFVQPDWIPDGRLKPGESYDDELTRKAAKNVFRFPGNLSAPAGTRVELSLDGPWQLARWDDRNMDDRPLAAVELLPDDLPLNWMGIQVPGDAWPQRPELFFGHRLVYQTRVDVPEELAGRSFILHFSATCYIASVFVNGRYCGGRKSVLVPWDCDISQAVEAGKENLVQVVVKGAFYCVDPAKGENGSPRSLHRYRNLPSSTFWQNTRWTDAVYPSSKGEGSGMQVGIVHPCKLVVAGAPYTSDVYVRTSVRDMRLDASVEVTNPSAQPAEIQVQCAAVHDKSNKVEKEFKAATLLVPAGKSATVDIGGVWADARLWWPAETMGDLPDVYRMRTALLLNGEAVDVREDTFGFRDITIRGRDFLLNGVPWRFYNWVDVPGHGKIRDHEKWLELYHAQNDGFHRFSWDHSRIFGHREQAIEYLDRYGIPSRCSMCIDGMFITQNLKNPVLWENWENHVRQVVKAYRNHPSIMHWSVGNEVMLVNAHNTQRSDYLDHEKKMAQLLAAAKEADPTRDGYEDGAGDLGGMGPINCVHYSWKWYPNVPHDLYEIPVGTTDKRPGERRETYLWSGENPLIGGEVFYYPGRPNWIAWFGGPNVYRSMREADLAAGRFARMGLEAHRWQNVASQCPWTGVKPGGSEKALARRAVFVREYNRCFFPAAPYERTIKVFNDTRRPETLTLRWQVNLEEKVAAQGEAVYTLAPGMNTQDVIRASLPVANRRIDGTLQLSLSSGADVVFEDSKPVSVLPRAPVPALPAGMLAVYDPGKILTAWLTARKVPFTEVAASSRLPGPAQVLVIGPKALTQANRRAWASRLRDFVLAGNTAIVLEQSEALEDKDLPIEGIALGQPDNRHVKMGEFSQMGGHFGSICHPVAMAHPILDGLQGRDFLCWAGDEINYRLSYAAPAGGAVSLVQAGAELKLSPMLEVPVGAGSYLLSQVLIGEKLNIEPVADRLMCNALAWAAQRMLDPPRAVSLLQGDHELEALLTGLGVDVEVRELPEAALVGRGVTVVRGTREKIGWLKRSRREVESFCQTGGWVMVCGLDDNALPLFADVVGIQHRSRPFRAEAVKLEAPEDPLVMGITDRDFAQRDYEMIASWMKLYRTSSQIFTRVLDASENIASFARGASGKLTDGMNQDVFWQYTEYYPADGSRPITFSFDRKETLRGMQVWTSGAYYRPKDVTIVFDGDEASAISCTLEDHDDRQDISWEPRAVQEVTITMTSHHPAPSTKELVTFDEIGLLRVLPEGQAERVQALTCPAGIVKYPIGKGGIVLNCLDWEERQPKDASDRDRRANGDIRRQNLQKKRSIMSSLLRNMGAAFKPAAGPEPTFSL